MIDSHGRSLLSLCKSTSLIIGNGRLYNDQNGEITFYSRNGCSTVDYFLLNFDDLKHVSTFEVNPISEFSDHCALRIYLKCKETNQNNDFNSENHEQYIKWDN